MPKVRKPAIANFDDVTLEGFDSNDGGQDPRLQIWASMVDMASKFATAAIQGVILVNGGAAVAMLAFLGHYVKGGQSPPSEVHDFGTSIAVFGIGAACGVATAMLGWVAQIVYITKAKDPDRGEYFGGSLRVVTALSAVAGIALFVYGLLLASWAFQAIATGSPPPS